MTEKFTITNEERLQVSLYDEKLARLRAQIELVARDQADFRRIMFEKYTENGTYDIVEPVVDGVGARARRKPVEGPVEG